MFEITSLKMIDIIHQCMDELIRPGIPFVIVQWETDMIQRICAN